MLDRRINSKIRAISALQANTLVTRTGSLRVGSTRGELLERAKQAQGDFDFARLAVELRGAGGWLLLRNWTVRMNAVPSASGFTSS